MRDLVERVCRATGNANESDAKRAIATVLRDMQQWCGPCEIETSAVISVYASENGISLQGEE